jgi:hypothetical protein
MAQVHAPVLAPEFRAGTVGLFDDTEVRNVNKSPPSETIDMDVSDIERRAMAAVGVVI